MSEKKKRQTSLWALNLSNPEDPLLKCLQKESEVSNLVRVDGSVNKSRLIEILICEALQSRFQKRGEMEGLGFLGEHVHRREVREAIATGKPLPTLTAPQPVIQQIPTPQTSGTTEVSPQILNPAQPQTVTQPAKIPEKKKQRREGIFTVGSSGHGRFDESKKTEE